MNNTHTTAHLLSTDEHAALIAYAAKHGRTWKQELRWAWMAASEPGILQQLRNASYFGPQGLIAYRLPKAVGAASLELKP